MYWFGHLIDWLVLAIGIDLSWQTGGVRGFLPLWFWLSRSSSAHRLSEPGFRPCGYTVHKIIYTHTHVGMAGILVLLIPHDLLMSSSCAHGERGIPLILLVISYSQLIPTLIYSWRLFWTHMYMNRVPSGPKYWNSHPLMMTRVFKSGQCFMNITKSMMDWNPESWRDHPAIQTKLFQWQWLEYCSPQCSGLLALPEHRWWSSCRLRLGSGFTLLRLGCAWHAKEAKKFNGNLGKHYNTTVSSTNVSTLTVTNPTSHTIANANVFRYWSTINELTIGFPDSV